ncbi:MAG TPA: sigma-70 family RNA polymerase sigma factor [Pirellulaceae bacterium]|nr:sigma-70 family RNA polymerase sigma factor [Pirellulaceae bacterium]
MMDDRSETRRHVERIAAGDQGALAGVFQQYRSRLRRMVQLRLDRQLQGRVDPSDVLQEAFLDISRRAAEYAQRPEMPFFLWLRMMTGQKLLEVHRRHLGTQQRDAGREISLCQSYPEVNSHLLASQLLGRFSTASQAAMRAEQQTRLEEILNGLEPIDREILTLRHFEELSNSEVTQVLGLSKSAASNRYIRALARLKDHLTDQSGFF